MSKKKMRVMFWTATTVLAFVPFMYGCATNPDANDAPGQDTAAQNNGAATEQNQDDVVMYGEVKAVDGDQVSVVLGEVEEFYEVRTDAGDGSREGVGSPSEGTTGGIAGAAESDTDTTLEGTESEETISDDNVDIPDIEGFTLSVNEVTFNAADIQVVDGNDEPIDVATLQQGDILKLTGTGDEVDFMPKYAQLVTIAQQQ